MNGEAVSLHPDGTAAVRFRKEAREQERREAREQDRHQEPHASPIAAAEDFEPAYLGWELARCAPGLAPDEARVLAAIAAACIASIQAGSTRLPIHGEALATLLGTEGTAESIAIARRLFEQARAPRVAGSAPHAPHAPEHPVRAVMGVPGDRKPLILDGRWLYSERMLALEVSFCARIQRRESAVSPKDARALAGVIAAVASGPPALTDAQKKAVREALRSNLALITGGPGTGKTMTVVALVSALAWMGVPMDSMAIAAPTGKAAQRLKEAIDAGLAARGGDMAEAAMRSFIPPPMTLHRLLGWSPSSGRFAHHENNPLPYRVVIVDEASMIDLALMDRLVRAVGENARLVLLGDADQLPSVDAGAVFRDLSAALGSARLSTNLRVAQDAAGRAIVAAAEAVNAGVLGDAARRCSAPSELRFEGVELLDARFSDAGEAFLDLWWRTRIADHAAFSARTSRTYKLEGGAFADGDRTELLALFAHYARARILCATRAQGAPASADAINERLMERLREGGGGPRRAFWRATDFAPGAPVMVQRNDYGRGLFNGDQGLVVRVDPGDGGGPRLMAVFHRAGSLDAFSTDASADLAPAFAMTVHKAQGSEFEQVALVLPHVPLIPPGDEAPALGLLTRELVYTAMTRARRSVVLVAPRELVTRAVSRRIERHSGVAERLGRGAPLRG